MSVKRRECFSKEQINIDLIKLAKIPFYIYMISFVVIAIGVGGVYLMIVYESLLGFVRILGVAACSSTSLFFLFLVICTVVRSFYLKRLAKSGDYHIIQDELIYDDIYHRTRKNRWIDYGTVCQRYVKSYLTFKCLGVYYIPESKHYSWSEQYRISSGGLRATAVPGDTFYIVTDDGKTPLVVYNTKLFEYKD